jgi:regulator of RNase E activity RraB
MTKVIDEKYARSHVNNDVCCRCKRRVNDYRVVDDRIYCSSCKAPSEIALNNTITDRDVEYVRQLRIIFGVSLDGWGEGCEYCN